MQHWHEAETFFAHYLGNARADDPEIAVVNADLTGLPPAWIGIAGLDVLRDDSRAFAGRLIRAGVAVESIECKGLHHGFARRIGRLRDAGPAVASAIAFFRRHCGVTTD